MLLFNYRNSTFGFGELLRIGFRIRGIKDGVQPIQNSRIMVKNSNVHIMQDQTDVSQGVKHDYGMKTENYDFNIDRLENQESR